ncbi:MAG: DUF5916 domain-containing protein [Leadbetterella sp.]
MSSQKINNHINYYIKRSDLNPPKIDGKIDSTFWMSIPETQITYQVLPMDTSKAINKTEVRFSYDSKNMYVLFINHKSSVGKHVLVESLKRDWTFHKNDNNLLFFDTFNDLTTGFTFGSNARGGQWDGLLSAASINLSWENKWKSEVREDATMWVWEAAIPFKTLRYRKNEKSWGVNFSRLDLKTTEKSSWVPIPRQFPTASLAYTGNLVWDSIPPRPGKNISLIPFVTGGIVRNYEDVKTNRTSGIGLDAKIGLTSALNLDLSVMPDFSQVEVDQQQINLDRFELFFPERRQFFLENGDIFNNLGTGSLRPFFSRRIGLKEAMLYGAKVSGKLSKNWRIGAMNIQTEKDTTSNTGANYSIVSLQRRVFKRSFFTLYGANKQTTNLRDSLDASSITAFSRFLGGEFNLQSSDNKWSGKVYAIATFVPGANQQNLAYGGFIDRQTRRYQLDISFKSVDSLFNGNEMGFVPRVDVLEGSAMYTRFFFPKSGIVLSHGPRFGVFGYFTKNGGKLFENTNYFSYKWTFRTQEQFTFWTATDQQMLLSDFDPTNFKKEYLEAGQKHNWASWGTVFISRPQSLFTYGFETRYGGYYADGRRLRLETELNYRFQPYAAIGMKGSLNRLMFEGDSRLPEKLKFNSYNLWLIGPRLDLTFTNKLFVSNFFQFNNQANNFNINSRLQWRYSPASDLFLVYTDNYTSDNFTKKNRSLVLKFTYWWNV